MPSCRRHAAPPLATFFPRAGATRGRSRHFVVIRGSFLRDHGVGVDNVVQNFYSLQENKKKSGRHRALRRDYRHQKMKPLLCRRTVVRLH